MANPETLVPEPFFLIPGQTCLELNEDFINGAGLAKGLWVSFVAGCIEKVPTISPRPTPAQHPRNHQLPRQVHRLLLIRLSNLDAVSVDRLV